MIKHGQVAYQSSMRPTGSLKLMATQYVSAVNGQMYRIIRLRWMKTGSPKKLWNWNPVEPRNYLQINYLAETGTDKSKLSVLPVTIRRNAVLMSE